MARELKIMLGQLNPTLGDLRANAEKARQFYQDAVAAGADYALLTELFLTGYSAKDLFLRPQFMADVETVLAELVTDCNASTILGIGAPLMRDGDRHLSYVYAANGQILHEVYKHNLPNYDVFDEKRWFDPGPIALPIGPMNTAICEDVWHESYGEGILRNSVEILIAPNASPYYRDKIHRRHDNARVRAAQLNVPVIYIHFVGVEDEIVFDGGSFVMHPDGEVAAQLPMFAEATACITMRDEGAGWRVVEGTQAEILPAYEADYYAMVLALRDYAAKTGFNSAILGLSGGIDSALVAAIACDALGSENVRAFMLPSKYTSQSSLDDAAHAAEMLGIRIDSLSIAGGVAAMASELAPIFGGDPQGLTEENIQPRLRSTLLMALSNQLGALLLTTGNKSEVAVGYATLYGDMAGGYNPIKDLYKMRVFETCRWRNVHHRDWMLGRAGAVVPEAIINKAPSAELRPDQKDSDSLPDYPLLDAILEAMVDHHQSVAEIVAGGFDRETVLKVQQLVFIAEYKRFQAAPGTKLTTQHFGTDRRYPIINHWRDR